MRRRYLIEEKSGCLHPKVMLASRLVKFVEQLKSSMKMGVRHLASLAVNDQRTVLGQNLLKVSREFSSNLMNLTPALVKNNLNYFSVPIEENWRIGPIHEILELDDQVLIPGFTNDETAAMLANLCTS